MEVWTRISALTPYVKVQKQDILAIFTVLVTGKYVYKMSMDCRQASLFIDGAVNGRKANEDVCRSSINYFWGLYFIAVNGRKGKRDF